MGLQNNVSPSLEEAIVHKGRVLVTAYVSQEKAVENTPASPGGAGDGILGPKNIGVGSGGGMEDRNVGIHTVPHDDEGVTPVAGHTNRLDLGSIAGSLKKTESGSSNLGCREGDNARVDCIGIAPRPSIIRRNLQKRLKKSSKIDTSSHRCADSLLEVSGKEFEGVDPCDYNDAIVIGSECRGEVVDDIGPRVNIQIQSGSPNLKRLLKIGSKRPPRRGIPIRGCSTSHNCNPSTPSSSHNRRDFHEGECSNPDT